MAGSDCGGREVDPSLCSRYRLMTESGMDVLLFFWGEVLNIPLVSRGGLLMLLQGGGGGKCTDNDGLVLCVVVGRSL